MEDVLALRFQAVVPQRGLTSESPGGPVVTQVARPQPESFGFSRFDMRMRNGNSDKFQSDTSTADVGTAF